MVDRELLLEKDGEALVPLHKMFVSSSLNPRTTQAHI